MNITQNNTAETSKVNKSNVCHDFVQGKYNDEILTRMRTLFEQSGLTLTQLSNISGVSDETVRRYFAGKTSNPYFNNMVSMILAMGGDPDEVLGVSQSEDKESGKSTEINPYLDILQAYQAEMRDVREETASLRRCIENITTRSSRSERRKLIATGALVIVLLMFVSLEIFDLLNPDWGRYRWAVEAIHNLLYNYV